MTLRFRLPYREDIFFSALTLLLVTVPIVFFMFAFEKYEVIKLPLWYAITGSALLVLFFQSKKQEGQNIWTIHKGLFLLLGFLELCLIISTVVGLDIRSSIFGYVPRYSGSLLMLSVWLLTIVLILLRLNQERLVFLLRVILFTAVLGSVVAIFQSFGVAFYAGPGEVGLLRAPGLLGNANFSALYIAALVPCAIVFFFQSNNRWTQMYYGISVLIMVVAVIVLSSRGALLALFAEELLCGILWAYFRLGKKQLLTLLCLFLVSLSLWYVSIGQTRPGTIQQTFHANEQNINLRWYVWDIARQAMIDHPVFGVGPSNFQDYFEQKRGKNLANQNGVYDDAHNLFLQFGANEGNLFLLGFIGLVIMGLLFGFRQLRDKKDTIALGMIVGLIGLLLAACFTPVSSPIFLLLALFLSGLYFYNSAEFQGSLSKLFLIPGACVGAVLILWSIAFFGTEVIFYRAYSNYLGGNIQRSLREVEWAIRFNPGNQLFYIYEAGNLAKARAPRSVLREKVESFIAQHKQDAHSYTAAANVYFAAYAQSRDKQYLEQSVVYMQQSLKLDPQFAQHYTQLALYYFAENELGKSLDAVTLGLSLDQDNVPGWLLLARLYQLQDRSRPAIASLEKAATMHPEIKQLQELVREMKGSADIKNVQIPIGIVDGSLE